MKESDAIEVLQALNRHPTLTTLLLDSNSFPPIFILFLLCMYSFLLDTHSLGFLESESGGSTFEQCSPLVPIAIAELISTNSVIQTLNLSCMHLALV
jgi:hypothetical protein